MSDDETIVVCMPVTLGRAYFDDDAFGVCHKCGQTVRIRPYMPQDTKKICLPCFERTMATKH
jgi:formylmethanofuran dehydrogenase subunit E